MGVSIVKSGKGTVLVEKSGLGQEHSEEKVGPPVVSSDPLASVTVSLGRTIQTAPYENAKVSVSLTLPCNEEEIDATFNKALDWVDDKTASTISAINGDL